MDGGHEGHPHIVEQEVLIPGLRQAGQLWWVRFARVTRVINGRHGPDGASEHRQPVGTTPRL